MDFVFYFKYISSFKLGTTAYASTRIVTQSINHHSLDVSVAYSHLKGFNPLGRAQKGVGDWTNLRLGLDCDLVLRLYELGDYISHVADS